MIAQSNVTHMLVGKDLDILASGAKDALAVGQIGVFLVGSNTSVAVSALSAGDRYTVAMKNQKGIIIESPVITHGSEKTFDVDYAAPTKETKAIGFDGTAGSIEVINSNNYVFHVFWRDNSKTFGHGQPVKFAAYRSSTAADQAEVAAGLVANFNKNFSREVPTLIKAEVLLNHAGADVTSGVLTVKNKSKYVAAATDATVYAVGDYVRFGTTITDPCYKVVAVDGTNDILTLDTPYQGASEAVADAAATKVTAAQAAGADAGILMTALDSQSEFEAGLVKYDFVVFDLELQDSFGATTSSELVAGSAGAGTGYEVAQNEWFLKGNRGETWRQGSYPKYPNLESDTASTYDQITINFSEANSKTIDREVKAYGSVIIATAKGSNNIYASLKTILGI